jgi:hypothetical protein
VFTAEDNGFISKITNCVLTGTVCFNNDISFDRVSPMLPEPFLQSAFFNAFYKYIQAQINILLNKERKNNCIGLKLYKRSKIDYVWNC